MYMHDKLLCVVSAGTLSEPPMHNYNVVIMNTYVITYVFTYLYTQMYIACIYAFYTVHEILHIIKYV